MDKNCKVWWYWNWKTQIWPIKVQINTDIDKIVVSNKFPFSKNDSKYFIDYKDEKKIRPLRKFLPKTIAYKRDFDKAKCTYFLKKDKKSVAKI